MRRAFTALLLLSTALSVFPLPGRGETGVTEKEIVIGACTPLSGLQKALGTNVLSGGEAYLDAVNATGGIYGRKLRVVERDDKWDPDTATSCFDGLAAEKMFLGAFFAGAPQSVTYARVAQLHKIPILILSGLKVLHEPLKRYVFTVRGTFNDEASFGVGKLLAETKARRFTIVSQEDALGAAIQDAVGASVSSVPSTVLTSILVPRGQIQDRRLVAQISAFNPEVVVLGAAYQVVVSIIKAVRAGGSKPIFVILTRGVSAERLAKDLGLDAEGVIISQGLPSTDRRDLRAVADYDQLLKRYFPGVHPTPEGLDGFLQAVVLTAGLVRAGKHPTREGWIDAVESMRDFDLGLGPQFRAYYSPSRHRAMANFVYTIVHDGKASEISDWRTLR